MARPFAVRTVTTGSHPSTHGTDGSGFNAGGVGPIASPSAAVWPISVPSLATVAPTIGPPPLRSFAQTSVLVSDVAR